MGEVNLRKFNQLENDENFMRENFVGIFFERFFVKLKKIVA